VDGMRHVLSRFFNEEELRTLCFDLGLDYDELPGDGKTAKARELAAYFERRSEEHLLVAACYQRRPNAYWDNRMRVTAVPGAPLPQAQGGSVGSGTRKMLLYQVGQLEMDMRLVERNLQRLSVMMAVALTAILLGGIVLLLR